MKKLILVTILLISVALLAPATAFAAASASLRGPGTVRAGDTITLTFNLSGSGLYGGSGTLSYDTSQLTLTSTSKKIASPWVVEFNGNKFVCYDNNLTSPINSGKAIFTATFKVNNSVAAGTNVTVLVTGSTATDGSKDSNIGSVSYSTTIATPLSSNANLSAMTVSNATISPAFNSDSTSYRATVPFTVKSLSISATSEDSGAKVSISGNSLSVGRNTVSVKVTAASGATKTYNITVTREQDPNYVPSSNANLQSLTIDNGILSPHFQADKTQYVVYLPFEITSFSADGTASDTKAKGVKGETKELSVGESTTMITVTAENGATRDYLITVVRMPEYGSEQQPVDNEPATPDPGDNDEDSNSSDPGEVTLSNTSPGVPVWLAIVLSLTGISIGFAGSLVVNKKKVGSIGPKL